MRSSANWKHRSKNKKAEKQGSLFTNIYKTVMGNYRKTHRKKITGIPDTLATENNSSNVLDNLGASYLGKVANPANSINRNNVAKQLLK